MFLDCLFVFQLLHNDGLICVSLFSISAFADSSSSSSRTSSSSSNSDALWIHNNAPEVQKNI